VGPSENAPATGALQNEEAAAVQGYRVRLRVVEEYEVALLAESPDEARAVAEAEVRGGGEFEAIQDSWPDKLL
jgi:hypothetical protein